MKKVLLHPRSLIWNRPIGNPLMEFAQLAIAHIGIAQWGIRSHGSALNWESSHGIAHRYLNPTLASKLETHTGFQVTSILAIVEQAFSGADCLSMCYNVKKCFAGSVVLVRNSSPKYACIMNTQTVVQSYQLIKEVFTSMHFHFDGTINRGLFNASSCHHPACRRQLGSANDLTLQLCSIDAIKQVVTLLLRQASSY
uniref:Uncharacterized protein n=1 Tax=Romanomermis culicivorax TaxID=13658 RepID=A0A915KSC4_ROMCU